MSKRILVTGGAGFIGSAVVRHIIRETDHRVLVVDKLTYAGNLDSLAPVSSDPRYVFLRADIADAPKMREAFETFQPDAVMHLAAESHVDRSIDGPGDFIQTNVVGTFTLLQSALGYWRSLPDARKETFRFHHISTDEVFGSLGRRGPVLRNDRIRSALALLGLQGVLRSSGSCLASHLRPARGRHQLLEQLRSVSFSRKADPADHHQRAGRPQAAGLWQGRQHPRLALRRRPRPRVAGGGDARDCRPHLLHRRKLRADQSAGGRGDLRLDG